MLRNRYETEKVHINFLYSNHCQISKIKDDINDNPIKCEQEYLKRCIRIRNLFLKRIDENMDSLTYYSYKECFKNINSGTHIYIDNIITLLEQDDKTLIELVNNEKNNYNYYFISQYEKHNHIHDEELLPPEISIALLGEIHSRMLNMIREYAHKIAESLYSKDKPISDMLDDEFAYHVTTSVLKE